MLDANLDTLNCIYFTLFLLGLGYALFIAITGGLSDVDFPDVHIDVPQIDFPGDVSVPGADVQIGGAGLPSGGIDAPDVPVSPLSPVTIAAFITTFGGLGVLSNQVLGLAPGWGLLVATTGALMSSGILFLFYSQVLIRSQASSELRRGELVGVQAEVTVPIAESGMGQVSYQTKSGRMSSTARSIDGRAIPRGQFVRIVREVGPQVLVEPLDLDSESG